jgi:MoaA/NifB/PqqE/SkfB family radical SAM enzyme
MRRDVTLLWALRSPCNLGCRYCYFGTIEEHRNAPPAMPGQLSHLSRSDLGLADVVAFVDSLGDSPVRRIFLAGGEPLIWPPVLDVVARIRAAGVQVVLCTNGIPLNRPEVSARLVQLGVDAVSVSLDSPDPGYNDMYRPARNRQHGWYDVVSGVDRLLTERGRTRRPAVGLYSVITARNLSSVTGVAELAAELGCDYFVPQPIALAPDHPLHTELSLTTTHIAQLQTQLDRLYSQGPVRLPAADYPARLVSTIDTMPGYVAGCFGGRYLYFIEPDGSVWSCPSSHKIAAEAVHPVRNILGRTAGELFTSDTACHDCALFTGDCVNMWPLMDFDRMLIGQQVAR